MPSPARRMVSGMKGDHGDAIDEGASNIDAAPGQPEAILEPESRADGTQCGKKGREGDDHRRGHEDVAKEMVLPGLPGQLLHGLPHEDDS